VIRSCAPPLRPAADDLRRQYLTQALGQIPRLLSLQDRNPFSPTYGSFHRAYWLEKVSDFPDAMAQIGSLCLALVYAHQLPVNPYWRQPQVRGWALAGLENWARIQHSDGSFDEFYPFERGWGTPTALTLYAAVEAYGLLAGEIPSPTAQRVLAAMRRAARLVAAGQSEQDDLANHHAMACLAVWKAARLLADPGLRAAFERLWRGFLRYHNRREGWSREYDGADPGYLSGTISLLAKLYQDSRQPEVLAVLRSAVEFASYFTYPDGHYAGAIGSRQTSHVYPHGFELLAAELPLAGAVAEHLLQGLAAGALVPPAVMPDRYLAWRTAEYLLAYLDARPRPPSLPPLPFERPPFRRWFPDARIYVARDERSYLVANLAKGGALKLFELASGRLIHDDCGVQARLATGGLATSQWIDPTYRILISDGALQVEGSLQRIPSSGHFTPLKMALFRATLAALGRSPRAAHLIKAGIRKLLILGTRPVPVRFRRRIRATAEGLTVSDEVRLGPGSRLAGLMSGGHFAVRYVPQSRYFQQPELAARDCRLSRDQLRRLHAARAVTVTRRVEIPSGRLRVEIDGEVAASAADPRGAVS
jgi:hypothetical protein